MGKGNGVEPSFHLRARRRVLAGGPVLTRLTRTMGFVELSLSPGVADSVGTSGDEACGPCVLDTPSGVASRVAR